MRKTKKGPLFNETPCICDVKMPNLNPHKLRKWVWPCPWTFN